MDNSKEATPHDVLIARVMDVNRAKSDEEWAAAREIERLRAQLDKPEVAPDDEALILNFESAIEVLSDPDRDEYADEVALAQAELDLNAAREALRRRFSELRAEVTRLGDKSDAEMLRVKACEHIALGDGDWQKLRNECPSTAAVAGLRDAFESAEARVAKLEAAQIPTPPEGMHYELVKNGTTPRQRANHKRHARHIAIMMNRKTT